MIGCRNHECWIVGKNTGQCTNGTCNCLKPLSVENQLAIKQRLVKLQRAFDNLLKLACVQSRYLCEMIDLPSYHICKGNSFDGKDCMECAREYFLTGGTVND